MTTMEFLSKESILAAQDIERELVEVPEWGGAVLVWGLTGTERDAYEAGVVEQRGRGVRMNLRNVRARLVAMAIRDEEGRRLFGDGEIAALGAKSGKVLDRLFDVAARLSGLSPAAVEELAGNSESGQSDDSGSG